MKSPRKSKGIDAGGQGFAVVDMTLVKRRAIFERIAAGGGLSLSDAEKITIGIFRSFGLEDRLPGGCGGGDSRPKFGVDHGAA